MSESNPLAPLIEEARPTSPDDDLGIDLRSDIVASPSLHATGRDNVVRSPSGITWPARCVVCNADVPESTQEHVFRWYPSWVPLLVLAGVFPALVAALLARKTLRVKVGLCDDHRAASRRMHGRAVRRGLAVFVLGSAAAYALESPLLFLLGLGSGALVYAVAQSGSQTLRLVKAEPEYVDVAAGPAFVASLPKG